MAKFIYNFEQLLNIKRKIEKQEQMNMGQAMEALSASIQKLEIIKYQQQDAMKEFQNCLGKGRIEQQEVKRLNEKNKFYHREVLDYQEIIKEKERIVEEVKERLKKALQERKTFEILKDKAYEEYIEKEKTEEAKINDEIVSFKYKNERQY